MEMSAKELQCYKYACANIIKAFRQFSSIRTASRGDAREVAPGHGLSEQHVPTCAVIA